MNKIIKVSGLLMALFALTAILSVCSFASNESVYDVLQNNHGRVMSISHRGNGTGYPKNSFEAVEAAVDAGADMVSVYVRQTSDNVLVLCESGSLNEICKTDKADVEELTSEEVLKMNLYSQGFKESQCKIQTLLSAAQKIKGKAMLVVDADESLIESVDTLAKENDLYDTLIFRTKMSSKKIKQWKENANSTLIVLGTYKGNVVFNASSHLKRLSALGQPFVQYQSKNYFNVSFNNFTAKNYGKNENARAVCAMYDKDLCGQREDNVSGWDEMVCRGFSVIETDDIDGLTNYINQIKSEEEKLDKALKEAREIDVKTLSQVSAKELSAAEEKADECLSGGTCSLGEVQSAYSCLLQQLGTLSHQSGKETKKGALNITAGKVIAVVVFGLLLVLGEVYLIKKKRVEKA